MARLTDITLYDNFYPAEGERLFRHRANYIGELYVQALGDYKPLKTSRISISLVPDPHPRYPSMAGSVMCVYQEVHTPTYDVLPDADKLRYLLARLHEAICYLCQTFHWDAAAFANAYQQVVDGDLKFRVAYPEKLSRNRKHRAHLLLEKTLTTTRLFACVAGEGQPVQALLHEGANWGAYDPVYAVVKHGKWLTRDAFGVHTARPECRVWYSLPEGRVCQEHPLYCPISPFSLYQLNAPSPE
jgi:hypothetical protein